MTFEKLPSGSHHAAQTFAAHTLGTSTQEAPAAGVLCEATPQDSAAALDAASGLVVAKIRGIEWGHRVAPADAAEVTSVEWTASEALRIHIGLWRRSQADERTQIPELVVPLETRGLAGTLSEIADRLTLSVQWDEL